MKKQVITLLVVFILMLILYSCGSMMNEKESLLKAIENKNVETVKRIINKNPKLIYTRYSYGYTLLHLIARKNEGIIEIFFDLSKKAPRNDYNPEANAAEEKRHNIYKAITFILKLFIREDVYRKNQLEKAKEIAEFLISKGLQINVADNTGYTPFHTAVIQSNIWMVDFFMSKGVDINVRNKNDGRTALLILTSYIGREQDKMIEYLISKGADINANDNHGWSPLYYTISISLQNGVDERVKLLISTKGADINIKSVDDRTPLHIAAEIGKYKIISLLISKGANVNAKDKYDTTPLHLAVRNGNKGVIELLISKGANVNAKNKYGDTLLNWTNNEEIANLLRKYGAR